MTIAEAKDIVKDYRLGNTTVTALKGVSLSVARGEFLAIAGPSGSGKTTLLNIISGIESPTAGQVYLQGRAVSGMTPDALAAQRAEHMGFVFQNFNLLPVLTALENVEYPLFLSRKIPAPDRRRLAVDALDNVGLKNHLNHRPMELSGGQRQRVAIARAMVINPALVLADEPTANLDHTTGNEILALMKRINRERETTFVFSTHDPKVMALATRLVLMQDGTITPTP